MGALHANSLGEGIADKQTPAYYMAQGPGPEMESLLSLVLRTSRLRQRACRPSRPQRRARSLHHQLERAPNVRERSQVDTWTEASQLSDDRER